MAYLFPDISENGVNREISDDDDAIPRPVESESAPTVIEAGAETCQCQKGL